MLYHHTRKLEHVHHGIVPAVRLSQVIPEPDCRARGGCGDVWSDPWHDAALYYEPAYEWLSRQTGWWPLFLAVGTDDEDLLMTGYQNQFRRQAESINDVMFSYEQLPDPKVFSDYDWWHLALNHGGYPLDGSHLRHAVELTDWQRRLIIKPSWRPSDWLRKARREPHSVQVVVPQLDLRQADRVYCRNQKTRMLLIGMGFSEQQVETRRLRAPRW